MHGAGRQACVHHHRNQVHWCFGCRHVALCNVMSNYLFAYRYYHRHHFFLLENFCAVR